MEKPKSIFKYEGINDFGLLNLKSGSIYFASPTNFNDPYDCNCGFNLKIDESKLEKYRKGEFPFEEDRPKEIQNKLNDISIEELKEILERSARITLEINKNWIIENVGIACFSETNDNLLMWSHYASSFKGFCLEFDTTYEPFSKLYQVKYSDNLPILEAAEILSTNEINENNLGESSKLWLTKSEDWKYEKEWRSMHVNKGTLFTYPQEALKSIYFGPLIDKTYREIICLIVQGQNRKAKFFEGNISKTGFKIEFTEFLYTSYIQAKESGLIK